jgi:hypothetical protein
LLPSSLLPIITLPATKKAAPSHQSPGKDSEKIKAPRTAVTMKLAEVLMTLTRTVEDAKVSARVNNPHIIPLNAMLSKKKSYHMLEDDDMQRSLSEVYREWGKTYTANGEFYDLIRRAQIEDLRYRACPRRSELRCGPCRVSVWSMGWGVQGNLTASQTRR